MYCLEKIKNFTEGLYHSIMPTEQITRFNKLMYIGPSHDPLPLPLAKEVIYVDWMPRYWGNPVHRCDNENGKFDCNIPECLIDCLISQAKDYFEIEEEPKVEWSMLQYRPIAKITFKWKEMYNITKNGNFTELTYIFETRDFEMGTNEKLKKFSDDVDMIWICGFYPTAISFKHIDLSTITMASRLNEFPNLEYKECTRFYDTNSIVNATRCNKDVTFLLGSLFSKTSFNFEEVTTYDGLNYWNHQYRNYDDYGLFVDIYNREKVNAWQVQNYFCPNFYKECEGWTLIHSFAKEGNLEALKVFLKKTDTPNPPDSFGNSPIDVARINNHMEVANFLEEYCEGKTWIPLLEAASKGNFDKIKQLIENGIDVDIKSTNGSTALTILVENGHLEPLQYLVQNGANVNTTRIDGKTPLHLAVENQTTTTLDTKNYKICEYLLEQSAKVDCECIEGRTPLGYAVSVGHFGIIKLLVDHGADIKAIPGLEKIIPFL